MDTTAILTTAPVWTEFSHDICETLNCETCLVLVGDEVVIHRVAPLVDAACRHNAVVEAFPKTARECSDDTTLHCCGPASMPHVTFTSEENQLLVQRCTAVFGRVPFLAIVDMSDDDDEHSFVFDLKDHVSKGLHTTSFTEALVEFLIRVGRGTELRCRQGAAPPPQDVFEPTHGAVLCEARAAVTSTFQRLLGKNPANIGAALTLDSSTTTSIPPACGALCVFWSDRCPCCPAMLMLIEAVVKLIRLVAARHADHPSVKVSFDFPFLVANTDNNEFSHEEWPVAEQEKVVPSLVAYPAPSYTPILFTGERLPTRLASFICEHCLPPGEVVACTPHITEEVLKVASQLSIDEMMTVLEEGSEGYAAALQAYEAFVKAEPTSEEVGKLYNSFNDVRAAALPFSLETAVRRISAEGGAAAEGSSNDALMGEGDGGEEAETDDDMAEVKTSGRTGVVVARASASSTPAVTVDNIYKRPRD